MPKITAHAEGAPCWWELGTTDAVAASEFYSKVFGWTVDASPIGPDQFYYMYQSEGLNVGAAYVLPPEPKGVPAHWKTYFNTASVDALAARVTEAKGHVWQGPMDVMTFGRMAVCRDAGGVAFAVWEPKDHIGVEVFGEIGTFCWSELATKDTEQSREFYAAVMGWTFREGANNPGYVEFATEGKFVGGMFPLTPQMGAMPPHWIPYIRVADCDASIASVKENGGKHFFGPHVVPGVGPIATVADPQGASFAIIQITG